jgi:hypothetical protein
MTHDNAALDVLALQNDNRQDERVLHQVYDFLGRFITFPSDEAHVAVALWVLHTHLMDRWDSMPRLALLSAEPASGKTRVLEILELLVPRPIQPVNASSAYLFTMLATRMAYQPSSSMRSIQSSDRRQRIPTKKFAAFLTLVTAGALSLVAPSISATDKGAPRNCQPIALSLLPVSAGYLTPS